MQGEGETQLADTPVPEGTFEYTGVVGEFNSAYQLIPTQLGDLPLRFAPTPRFSQVQEGGATVEVSIRAVSLEGEGTVSVSAAIGEESTADDTDITGFDGSETFTFSKGDSNPKALSFDVVSDGQEEGVERLEIILSSEDGQVGEPGRFTLWLLDEGEPAVQSVIAEGDSGDVLIDALQQQFADPRPLGDDFARDSMYAVVYNEEADTVEGQYSGLRIEVDPSEGDPSTIAADKGINNEHTWPQSKGAGDEPATSDLHILVPARAEVNSARSNFPYGE
ncbi:MAG: DNA-binding protein, partial [Bacteroidetes bacterium QH_1_61_8]